MASVFPLRLVTPTGIVFEGEVEAVTAVNPLGQFGVLAEHINFITALVPGILEIKLPDASSFHYVVAGGLAEVKDGAMTVLADSAEKPESIDRPQADEQLKEAEAKFVGVNFYAAEFENAYRALLLAQARRSAAELRPSER